MQHPDFPTHHIQRHGFLRLNRSQVISDWGARSTDILRAPSCSPIHCLHVYYQLQTGSRTDKKFQQYKQCSLKARRMTRGIPAAQGERDELAGGVLPVTLVPRDVVRGQELLAAEQRTLPPEVAGRGIETLEGILLLVSVPLEVRHGIVMSVPVVVSAPAVPILISCTYVPLSIHTTSTSPLYLGHHTCFMPKLHTAMSTCFDADLLTNPDSIHAQ